MGRDKGSDGVRGLSVCLPIPAGDAALFRSASTGAILEFLARNRFESFSQRTLADHVDASESAVQRAVDVLVANDLVEIEYEGNRKLVRIDRERLSVPGDPFLRIPQSEYQEPVKAAVDRLRDELDEVVGIVLYGSVAKGEADRRSDVDLWIAVREERAASQRRANDVIAGLEERRFDGDRYAFHVVVESLASVPSFTDDVGEILHTGIAVYDTESLQELRTMLIRGENEDA